MHGLAQQFCRRISGHMGDSRVDKSGGSPGIPVVAHKLS
jgi:hypothetical protein